MRMKTVMAVSLLVVFVLIAMVLLVTTVLPENQPYKFEARNGELFIDGKQHNYPGFTIRSFGGSN